MTIEATMMSPSVRVEAKDVRQLFFMTTNQDREESLISARGRPFNLPSGFRPRVVPGSKASVQEVKAVPKRPASAVAASSARGAAHEDRHSGASRASRVSRASRAESLREEVRLAVEAQVAKAMTEASGAGSQARADTKASGSQAGTAPRSANRVSSKEAGSRKKGDKAVGQEKVQIDWASASVYGMDYKQPPDKCYLPDHFAKETKIAVQKSSVPFNDPRGMPAVSVTQHALIEGQIKRPGRAKTAPGLSHLKATARRNPLLALDTHDLVTMYRQDMTGEESERRVPFSPRNIPGQPVISMSEILMDPARFGVTF